MATDASLQVSAQQLRWFRIRRSALVEPLATPVAVAARLCGIQAQINTAAQLAINRRCEGAPSCAAVEDAVLEQRALARITGPRGTLHLFDPEDLALISAVVGADEQARVEARTAKGLVSDPRDAKSKRRDGAADLEALRQTCAALRKRLDARTKVPRTVSRDRLDELGFDARLGYGAFAQLTAGGDAVRVERGDNATPVIASRRRWLPKLDWRVPDEPVEELARRYFSAHPGAGERDFRYWLGAKAKRTKGPVAALREAGELVEVEVEGLAEPKKGRGPVRLVPAELVDGLREPAPKARDWPTRLLYRFDPLILADRDKGLWLDDPDDGSKVWHHTHVEPVILCRGRIAGTWRYEKTAKGLDVRLAPFAKLPTDAGRELKREAQAIADALELELRRVA